MKTTNRRFYRQVAFLGIVLATADDFTTQVAGPITRDETTVQPVPNPLQ